MPTHDERFSFEEEFHAQDRKVHRKERKAAKARDRSKYKKSDQDQLKKHKENSRLLEEHALRGRVLAIRPEGILVRADSCQYLCQLRGVLKKERTKAKNLVVVGDFVHFLLDPASEGAITFIEERRSVLSRADHLSRLKEQFLAANIDQVLITASVLMPSLKPALIDRYIIAARKGNMTPLIVINKIDLFANPSPDTEQERNLYEEIIRIYSALNFPVFPVSTITGEGLPALKNAMQGKASVFSGQSGVGKSALINALLGTDFPVGDIAKTMKGSHTTTSAQLIPMENGGFCIDTPGIRSFGVWDLSAAEVQSYFSEILNCSEQCKYPNCHHLEEPECAVKWAVENGEISRLRYDSYCALMAKE